MVNTSLPEFQETKVKELPPADLDTLMKLRQEACSAASMDFKLQPQQRFLRRVLSPDSPTRGLLMVHGTGTGKTCTGIQIAEEYIIRPEFQGKKVFVLASPSVQENFRHQIFDASQVRVDEAGLTVSKQCTGRRYLDILQRSKSQTISWSTQAGREAVMRSASKIIDEFYEFWGYEEFGNELERQTKKRNSNDLTAWIHETYDNRLMIIDEAHNLRDTSETTTNEKIVNAALRKIIQIADGMTIVLLTATPMYDTFDEIIDYFNLFRLNERESGPELKSSDFFKKTGDFVSEDMRIKFRDLSNKYISYVKGENPFTFPFRLDPPIDMIATIPRTHDISGGKINTPIKYLKLTQALMYPYQSKIVRALRQVKLQEHRTICVLPDNKNSLRDVMVKQGNQWKYSGPPFLSKSNVANYSAKFSSILQCIADSKGIVLVYSNIVDLGAQLFAMCLEEHGFAPALGDNLMAETSGEVAPRSSGRYALFTSNTSRADIKTMLGRLKHRGNKDGDDIRIIIASPKVSEGVDFKYVRQVHILEPWYNMSRMEQVIGRGMRTCSHAALPFLNQNCTVYLHVNRHSTDTQETLDEYIYRVFVEKKAIAMAKVKKVLMESAMDCKLEHSVNSLPQDWLDLEIHQIRAQRDERVAAKLKNLTAPIFMDNAVIACQDFAEESGSDHIRPLSAILDVRDEILDKLMALFSEKPVWSQTHLIKELEPYEESIIRYILQDAVTHGFKLKDTNNRIGHLESREGAIAFAVDKNPTQPTIGEHQTMLDRLIPKPNRKEAPLSKNTPLMVEMAQGTNENVEEGIRQTDIHSEIRSKVEKEIWFKPEPIEGIKADIKKLENNIQKMSKPPKPKKGKKGNDTDNIPHKELQEMEDEKNKLETFLRKIEDSETKRLEEFKKRYSGEVLDWYYIDNKLTGKERNEYILDALNSGNAPPYLKAMVVDGPEKFYVFGPDEFYTPDGKKYTPIGASLDAYNSWRNKIKDRFIAGKDNFFAAMKGETFIMNVDDKLHNNHVKIADRTKVIGGRSCAFFDEVAVNALASDVFGITLPAKPEKNKGHTTQRDKDGLSFLTKPERCREISLLFRKAILDNKPGIDWYTPEEWAVLTEESSRKELLARLNKK